MMRQRFIEWLRANIVPITCVALVAMSVSQSALIGFYYAPRVASASALAPRTYAVPTSYQVLTDFDDVLIVVPMTTTNEEDAAAVRDLARQINERGRDARVTVCAESQLFPGALDCPLVFYFAR